MTCIPSEADNAVSFIHGGLVSYESGEPYNQDMTNIFVLSLPSFVWHRIDGSSQTMRGSHDCQVIGGRQMLVIGGRNPTNSSLYDQQDPWINGLGIFDMTALQWTSGYDAKASSYAQPDSIKTSISQKRVILSHNPRSLLTTFSVAPTLKPGTLPPIN